MQRCNFEQQKASLLKQEYLSDSPHLSNGRRECTEVSEYMFNGDFFFMAIFHPYKHLKMYSPVPGYCPQVEQTRVFGCIPITPSPKSGAAHELHQEGVGAQTPDTPELYSALNLSYHSRSARSHNQSTKFCKMDDWNTSL